MISRKPTPSSCFWYFQDLFGDDHNQNGFQMFDSSKYHSQDLLFKDATVRAVPVGKKTTYLEWLGPDYVVALEGMLSQQCSGAGRGTGLLCQHLWAPRHPHLHWGCGIKTLRKLKGIPGLGEAEEDIPVSYTIKESPNREACR